MAGVLPIAGAATAIPAERARRAERDGHLEQHFEPEVRLSSTRMEYSALSFDLKSLSESGHIEGLAAGYGNVDLQGDVITPGAFASSLAGAKSAGRMPAMLLHHDLRRPVGRWDELVEHGEGLIAKGKLTLESSDGREAYALLRDRALTGLSVGFSNAKRKAGDNGSRVITEAQLHEVSLVSIPANPKARISSVKSIGNVRDIEDLLRDCGVSGRKAKAAATAAWRAINEQDETAAIEAKLADLLTPAIASLERYKGL